jgi:signal transduction histidine kinase
MVLKKQRLLLLENEKELMEANASKDKFFSIIAHDLRAPVGIIAEMSKMLITESADFDEENRREIISSLNHSAENTYTLLDNLLLWARSQQNRISYNPETFDINSTIREVVGLFRYKIDRKEQCLEVPNGDELKVWADQNMVTTVIRNLLFNAIKYTPHHGTIKIHTGISESEECEIQIIDTGVGISENRLAALFQIDKTESTKGTDNESGTGLGILLCNEFIQKNKGVFKVKSKLNEGSVFSFTLPMYNSLQ